MKKWFGTRFNLRISGLMFLSVILPLLNSCSSKCIAPPPHPPSSSPAPAPIRPGTEVVASCLSNRSTPQNVVHEVAPLETVWRISKMYDVPMNDIYRANSMNTSEPLQVGQKLIIPNTKTLRNVIPLYPNTQWTYIVVHHTATDIGNATLVHRTHQDRGFWYGLGYHFLIDNGTLGKGDGQIEAAPRWIKQQSGAHCKAAGMNSKAIGISLVGNFNVDPPTPNQIQSLTHLLNTLCQYYHIPSSHIIGHGDVEGASTDCPGRRFPWPEIRHGLTSP